MDPNVRSGGSPALNQSQSAIGGVYGVLSSQTAPTWEDVPEDEDPNTLHRPHKQAIAYYEEGNLVASENLNLRVLAIRKRRLGDEHLDTLCSMNNLAATYRMQGRLAESEQLHLQVLSVRKRKLGDEHVHTLDSMHSLAVTYKEQNRLEESEHLHLQVLSTRKRKLGDEHVDTLRSMHSLAVTCFEQGRLAESEQLHLQVLSIRKRKLGDEHIDTLHSMHNLAVTYLKQGRLAESEQLHLQVLSIRKRILGDEHIDTLWSMHNLAVTYRMQARLEESEQLHLRVLPIRKRILGDKHTDTLDTIRNLAAIRNHDRHRLKIAAVEPGSDTEPEYVLNDTNLHLPVAPLPRDVDLNVVRDPETPSRITAQTSVLDAFRYLVRHGCIDLTSRLDLPHGSEAALSGGRFGDVWRGTLPDHTRVAIKCLRLHTVDEVNSKVVKHAARELYFWSKLKHPNVLELLGVALFQEQLAMISPWMENGTLNDHVRKHPDLDRWSLCIQASEGLEYIHSVGMVHGDLKASNILVSSGNVVKLNDFGNSVLTNCSLAFSTTHIAGGGTARWMAPELITREDKDAADRSAPADVYALGMTILETVTGRLPFCEYRQDPMVTWAVIEGGHPRRPAEFAKESRFGNERWEMLLRCWDILPERRPAAGAVKQIMLSLL